MSWAAAWDAAWAAAQQKLEPTRLSLMNSAEELLERLIALSRSGREARR